jgi:hypothetical protein
MKTNPVTGAMTALLLLGTSMALTAGDNPAGDNTSSTFLNDLTPANFFTDGWDQAWSRRPREDGAPDMALLRAQTNFLVRVLRTDYYFERMTDGGKTKDVQFLQQFVEYAFNRRFQIALIGNYEWVDTRIGHGSNGEGGGALARVQLVDAPTASYSLNIRVAVPNAGIGEHETTTSFALAGWHDLTPFGLKRTGLYWHVQEETMAGPHAQSTKQNDLTYDLSLAKTWTHSDALIGNLSTFVEAYAKTDLDGAHPGTTVATLTPGVRFTIAHRHVLMCGVDFPVTQPRPFEEIYRFTYIYNF